jgi:hypothetical protein
MMPHVIAATLLINAHGTLESASTGSIKAIFSNIQSQ